MESFLLGRQMNLAVTLVVAVYGPYLLYRKHQEASANQRFLFRALVCWWLSWASWVVLWGFITVGWQQDVLVLIFSDTNTVILLLLYFYVTRGSNFSPAKGIWRAALIAGVLTASYWTLYRIFPPELAKEFHINWSMALAVVSPILVGWALTLRFKGSLALGIGLIYGFAQPAAFTAILDRPAIENHQDLFGKFFLWLAFMKVLWATIVTRYLLATPDESANLIRVSPKRQPLVLFRGAPRRLHVQTVALIICLLGVMYLHSDFSLTSPPVRDSLLAFAALVTIVRGSLEIYSRFSKNHS